MCEEERLVTHYQEMCTNLEKAFQGGGLKNTLKILHVTCGCGTASCPFVTVRHALEACVRDATHAAELSTWAKEQFSCSFCNRDGGCQEVASCATSLGCQQTTTGEMNLTSANDIVIFLRDADHAKQGYSSREEMLASTVPGSPPITHVVDSGDPGEPTIKCFKLENLCLISSICDGVSAPFMRSANGPL